MNVVVIGAGASGLMAAITAARQGAMVTILEQKDRIGKKILSTGNGRCNFTNLAQEPQFYRSENESFPWKIIEKFSAQKVIAFFLELGIYSKNRNGYMYPHSDQATAVLDVLRMEMERLHVRVLTEHKCTQIVPGKKGFKIQTNQGVLKADKVILSAGSKAAPVTGSDGSGYDLAKGLGHHLVPVLPALVQLRCKENFYKAIAGVRVNGTVSLYVDKECVAKDTGEIQLTNYGISGIPVFQVSRYAALGLYQKKKVTAHLNFMPGFTEEQFHHFLMNRVNTRPKKTVEEFLIGMFHKKLCDLFIKCSSIDKSKQVGTCTAEEIHRLEKLIQQFEVEVKETNSFEQAQVCAGGIDTTEVQEETLESRYIPGLYFTGEILDVDGICGGYNLQWAWSSGYVAAMAATANGTIKGRTQ